MSLLFSGYPCLQRMDSVHSDETDLPLPKIDEWSEDCLTLNVYTPSLKGNYPVLMYIHGGGWQHGKSPRKGGGVVVGGSIVDEPDGLIEK